MHHLRFAWLGLLAAAWLCTPTAAQQAPQRPQAAPPAPQSQPPGQPPQAAARPYKPLAVTEPKPFADAGWAAFRKRLEEVAGRKDRNALAALVAPQGFFWMRDDGDAADKRKSGIDNLATAIGLSNQDGSGWELLADFASDETAIPFPDRPGVVCSPAGPQFNAQELEKLAQATQTDIGDWGYTVEAGVEVRAAARANAPVIEKLGVHFVRVLEDTSPNAAADFIRIVTPSGKVGFIASDAIVPLGSDQLCYGKDPSGAWKITGFLGGQ
ncbi:MAG: SH3 domain-containing protein [Xanthobacteraceae bacterium]|nr:SH3 domain-containing protein [Xanthobacteraceae bacterium]